MRNLWICSEMTDPCFYTNLAIKRLETKKDPALLIITKDVGECYPIYEYCVNKEVPFLLHATITGFGGTKFESGVKPYYQSLLELKTLIDKGILLGNRVILRVDPLCLHSDFYEIIEIVKESKKLGITKVRVSILDYYPHVRTRLKEQSLPYCSNFSLDKDTIESLIKDIYSITVLKGLTLYLCAEQVPDGLRWDKRVSIRGCASIEEWKELGIDIKPRTRSLQRKSCTCDAQKNDLLSGVKKGCDHRCLYCYWKW